MLNLDLAMPSSEFASGRLLSFLSSCSLMVDSFSCSLDIFSSSTEIFSFMTFCQARQESAQRIRWCGHGTAWPLGRTNGRPPPANQLGATVGPRTSKDTLAKQVLHTSSGRLTTLASLESLSSTGACAGTAALSPD